jgi:CheY-like chemotaxis protein
MANTALIVCPDATVAEVLRRILEDRGLRVEHRADREAAEARLGEERFSVVLVDCEDEAAALSLIGLARGQSTEPTSLIVAVVDARNEVRDLFAEGANFMLYKPVSEERAANSLRAAWSLMPGERRRKRRIPVATRAAISYATTEDATAPLLNLSGDGVAILSPRHLPTLSRVYFQFALPGQAAPVRLSGEVVWQDVRGQVGLQFAQVPQASRRVLEDWLQASLLQHAKNAEPRPIFEHHPQPDESQPAERADASTPPPDRRAQSRRACRLGVNVYTPGGSVLQHCTMTDISAGGCYVETTQPLAADSRVVVEVRTLDLKVRVRGQVMSMHRGYGMGVEFSAKTAEDREQVKRLIAYQDSQVEAETIEVSAEQS